MTTWLMPSTVQEAVTLVADGATPVGGGAALMSTAFAPLIGDRAVDLLPVLPARIDADFIGAGATLADVCASASLRSTARAVCQAADATGTALVRRQATVGGTLALRALTADLFPALAVHNAVVITRSLAGAGETPLADYLAEPGGPHVVVGVRITPATSSYRRVAPTPGVALASVAVARTGASETAYAGAVGHDACPVPVDRAAALRTDARATGRFRAALVDALLSDCRSELDQT